MNSTADTSITHSPHRIESSAPTPGPWFVDGCSIMHRLPGENDFERSRVYLAEVLGRNSANARLIAAAPDLLEALQRIVALSEGYPLLQAEMDIPLARAAIAKATA